MVGKDLAYLFIIQALEHNTSITIKLCNLNAQLASVKMCINTDYEATID